MKNEDSKILKEYAKLVLAEYGDALGPIVVSPDSIAKIFVKPFSDVIGVAKKTISTLGVRSRSLLKVFTRGVLSTLIPGVSADYSEIYRQEKSELDNLRYKYRDVLKDSYDALKGDAQLIGFMISPINFIASSLVARSPRATLRLINLLAGKNRYVSSKVRSFSSLLKSLKRTTSKYEKSFSFESRIIKEQGNIAQQIADFVNEEQTQRIIENSPMVQEMRQDVEQIVEKTLQNLKQKIDEVLNVQKLEDLERIYEKRFIPSEISKIPENETETVKNLVLGEAKESVLETYTKMINQNLKDLINSGIEQNSKIFINYNELLNYINSKLSA